jgi:ribosomal protein L20A (L18A)
MNSSEGIDQDIQILVKDLFRDDEIASVIRTHAKIEDLLTKTVEALTPKPQHLKRLNLDHDGRITLALALGLKDQFGPPFRAFAKLRNDFAHKPDTALTKEAVENLYKSLGSEEKQQIQECFRKMKASNSQELTENKYSELSPNDQFKIIAVTLWSVVRAAVHLHGK